MQASPLLVKRVYDYWADGPGVILDPVVGKARRPKDTIHPRVCRGVCDGNSKRKTLRTHRDGRSR